MHDILKMMRTNRNVWFHACLEHELLVRSGAVGTSAHGEVEHVRFKVSQLRPAGK